MSLFIRAINKFYRLFCQYGTRIVGVVVCAGRSTKWSAYFSRVADSGVYKVHYKPPFSISNSSALMRWRGETFLKKEPETIRWLESLPPGSIMFDVGANIGMYSLFAGVRGVQVFAFEPEASNFYYLNRNIFLNQLDKLVRAFPLALSKSIGPLALNLHSLEPGAALHQIDGGSSQRQQVFAQGSFAVSLDSMIDQFGLPIPYALKVDVDGVEDWVIAGADALLKKVTTVLIELEVGSDLFQKIISYGFVVTDQGEVVTEVKTQKKFQNYIFRRPTG